MNEETFFLICKAIHSILSDFVIPFCIIGIVYLVGKEYLEKRERGNGEK